MIDFTKSKGTDIRNTGIVNHPLLPFKTENVSDDGEIFKANKIDEQTGERRDRTPYKRAEYKGLVITYSNIENPTSFYISGSLHKYFNGGLHNYNDFGWKDSEQVILSIKRTFGLDLTQCHMENLEIGIGFPPPPGLTTRDVITNALFHGRIRFSEVQDDQWGLYIQCEHSHFTMKLYDKSLQYRKLGYEIEEEILRFEIKFRNNETMKEKLGVSTLNDLLSCSPAKIKKLMLKEWNKVFLFDPTLKIQNDGIYKYSTRKFWEELANRRKKTDPTKKSNSAYYKHRKKYQNLVDTYSEKVHQQIGNIIEEKIDVLFARGATFDHLPILSEVTPPNEKQAILYRVCPVTGLDISMQKKESFLLSNTGLKFYEERNPKKFDFIKKTLLTGNHNEFEKSLYSKISKQIRNRYFNKPERYSELPTLF